MFLEPNWLFEVARQKKGYLVALIGAEVHAIVGPNGGGKDFLCTSRLLSGPASTVSMKGANRPVRGSVKPRRRGRRQFQGGWRGGKGWLEHFVAANVAARAIS
jgi:hypothetical protein